MKNFTKSNAPNADWQTRCSVWTAFTILFFTVVSVMAATIPALGPPQVAVLDFSVAPQPVAAERWGWAQGGMADLLQIQLQKQGLGLLDRDLIASVLKEQRLSVRGVTAADQLSIAKLLNARFLVTGRVIPLDGERFRVEAGVFSVETVESIVAAGGEGRFPLELVSVLETVAGRIVSGLKTKTAFHPASAPSGHVPKPESLIMFHRGLDGIARGEVASAVAYFMNAAALDDRFTLPLLWEIKAYEIAGLTAHAALRRQEIADVLQPLGLAADAAVGNAPPSSKRVVAVLAPVVTGLKPAADPSVVSAELTQALLSSDRVRVFAPEGIGAAVAEQDLRLSALFESQFAPRYGRWLAADGLLLCRVSATNASEVMVELSLANPLTASVGLRVKRFGRANEWQSLLCSAADELLDVWTSAARTISPAATIEVTATNSPAESVPDLRPIYRGLVEALASFRREPQKRDAHRALANAFGATGRPKLAAYEVDEHLKTLDIRAPKADQIFLETHGWAAGSANPQLLTNLIGQLLDTYPDSLAAGCLRYNLAVNAWRAQNWSDAVHQAAKSRLILQALILGYDRNAKTGVNRGDADCEVAAATYFLEAVSLQKLGRPEEAKAVLRNGLAFMNDYQVRDFCLPYGPMIGDFFGPQRIYGFGGDRPGIKTRLEQELAALEGRPYPPPTKPEPIASANSSPVEDADSGAAWAKRGQMEVSRGNYWEALNCYQRAVTKGVRPVHCAGLNTALVEMALERDLSHPAEAAQKLRRDLGLAPGAVSWVEWFAAGRKYHAGRNYDLNKAIACYRSMMQFLENPGQGGFYHLEKEPCCDRYNLRWGGSLGEVDLRWTATYDERWYSAAFYLAECLIALDQKEEAAKWLRRIAITVGGDRDIPLLTQADWTSSQALAFANLGVRAAQVLEELHQDSGAPKFGDTAGPYKVPPTNSKARPLAPPLPPANPRITQALTNVLAETNSTARTAGLKTLADTYGHATVPAALQLLSEPDNRWDEAALQWLLEQTATKADAPWVAAACVRHLNLVGLAQRLDPAATAVALAEEWRAQELGGNVSFWLKQAVIESRVRPLYALVLRQISVAALNHHSDVFRMDRLVAQERSEKLTTAFRQALATCLRTKLRGREYYELERISQIALRYGVGEAVEATVVCAGASSEQLRKTLSRYVDLPPGDAAALAYLRTNGSHWQWDAPAGKYKPMTGK